MPRPPPSRAITGCCTCTPRPTPRASSRPAPHPSTSLCPASSSSSSSSSPSHHPPYSQPFTTSSAQAATTTPAPSDPSRPPVLDFLYPGFGFFSRSLPPIVNPSSSSSNSASTTSSNVVPGPPPPIPYPLSNHDSPNYRSQEGKKLLLSSARPSSTTTLFGYRSTTSTRRPSVPIGQGISTSCICGRMKQTCLRCRGKSTGSNAVVATSMNGYELTTNEKGKMKETISETDQTPDASNTPEITSPPPPSSTSLSDPLQSFRTFFNSLDSILPSSRTSTSSTVPHRSLSSSLAHSKTRRELFRKRSKLLPLLSTSTDSPSDLLNRLSDELDREVVWDGLSYHEKLDSIRLFSRISKLLSSSSSSSSSTISPSLLNSSATPLNQVDEVEKIRIRAGEEIERFLNKLENDGRSSETKKKNDLSEAGLWIESFSLRGTFFEIPDPSSSPSSSPPISTREGKFQESIRSVFENWDAIGYDEVEKKKRVQAIRTGLANLFEAWERGKTKSGESALKLIYEYDLSSIFDTVLTSSDSSTSASKSSRRRHEIGYNDLLKRRYGLLLGRLQPSPLRFLEEGFIASTEQGEGTKEAEEVEAKKMIYRGLHVVEYLSKSGSAGEARKVWDKVEQVRSTLMSIHEGEDPEVIQIEDRLRSMTALVDGLIMEAFYEDANSLITELEGLAKRMEESDEPTSQQSALNAYRILAKLASNQGREAILERILKKVDNLTSRSSSSTPTTSSPLDAFARRLRAKSARFEIKAVRFLFTSFQSTLEWEQASKEDQARLWSQVILAQTRINDVESAIKSLQDLIAYGLRPPLSAVNSIMFGFARRGDVETVDELFRQLLEGEFERLKPDVGSWNSLVLARVAVKDPSAASKVIEEMKRLGGVEPNRQTWTTLMAGLVEASQWRDALKIYQYLEKHPSVALRPDTATTNVILRACVLTATPASSVLTLFRQLLIRGFRPNMMTYTLVLQSLVTAGLMDVAEELYLMMDRPSSSSSSSSDPATPQSSRLPTSMSLIRPDQFIYSTLIAGYLKQGEKEKARACLAEMRRRGIEPTSITLAIIVGSQVNGRTTPAKVKSMVKEARALLTEDGTGFTRLRKSQFWRRDRKLVMRDEAAAVLKPIFKSAAEKGLTGVALNLLEELQSRGRKTDEVPVELYTMFMDTFKRGGDPEVASDNIKTIWDRIYESVAERFMSLTTSPSSPSPSPSISELPSPLTAHSLTTSRLDIRIDPAHASILCVPLTIYLESLARVGRGHLFGLTWRALARQGFAFDASNWNVLALYFARDLQLERAFWIAEHILCRPEEDASLVPSPSDFEADFAKASKTTAVPRIPSRLSTLRHREQDRNSKRPLDIHSLLSPSSLASTTTPSTTTELDISETVEDSRKMRQALFWHPYGSLLEALGSALETLTLTGDVEVGGTGKEKGFSALEIKEKLVSGHPRTMEAIKLWRTRGERKEREKERYLSVHGRGV
ncbi:hypothetical protein JCM5350_005445 [Sporobolomyces pararoseus]